MKKMEELIQELAYILRLLVEHPSILWIILAMWFVYMLTPLILSLAGLI
jgi:hypothetical protein